MKSAKKNLGIQGWLKEYMIVELREWMSLNSYKVTLLVLPQPYAEVVVDESMVLTKSRQNFRGLTDWGLWYSRHNRTHTVISQQWTYPQIISVTYVSCNRKKQKSFTFNGVPFPLHSSSSRMKTRITFPFFVTVNLINILDGGKGFLKCKLYLLKTTTTDLLTHTVCKPPLILQRQRCIVYF